MNAPIALPPVTSPNQARPDASMKQLSLEAVNELSLLEFVEVLWNVVHRCPMAAAVAWTRRPFASLRELHATLTSVLDGFKPEEQVRHVRGNPELGGLLARRGDVGPECRKEQAAAGILQVTEDERRFLDAHNAAYRQKFGFPFVLCARENRKESILRGLTERIHNSPQQELATAVQENKKIAWFRLCDLVTSQGENCGVCGAVVARL